MIFGDFNVRWICSLISCNRDRKDAAGKKPTDPAYNTCTLHLPADFVKGLSGGQVCINGGKITF
jgi:hypothetical protein